MARVRDSLRAIALSLGVVLASSNPAEAANALTRPFSLEEFPRYFLKPEFRRLPPNQVPATEVARARKVMEQALQSVFRRLTVPLVPDGETVVKNVRYFDHLDKKLRPIDPDARL